MSDTKQMSARKLERLKLIKERHRKLILEPRGRVVMEDDFEDVIAPVEDVDVDVDVDLGLELEDAEAI